MSTCSRPGRQWEQEIYILGTTLLDTFLHSLGTLKGLAEDKGTPDLSGFRSIGQGDIRSEAWTTSQPAIPCPLSSP